MKQYMVIETFLPACKQQIYERFHAQEACGRAFRFVGGCRNSDGRAWLLAIRAEHGVFMAEEKSRAAGGFHGPQ